jgi:hypothetical protein
MEANELSVFNKLAMSVPAVPSAQDFAHSAPFQIIGNRRP